MVFAITLREWSEASTIHGVRYACEPRRNILLRVLWVAIVSFSAVIAIHMSVTIYFDWKEQVKLN